MQITLFFSRLGRIIACRILEAKYASTIGQVFLVFMQKADVLNLVPFCGDSVYAWPQEQDFEEIVLDLGNELHCASRASLDLLSWPSTSVKP